MAGIFGLYSTNKLHHNTKCIEYFYSYSIEHTINEQHTFNNFSYGRSVINKFGDDRILYENQDLILSFEGVCYNIKKGKLLQHIIHEFTKNKMMFLNHLSGVFSGFIYKKKTNELYIFNDPLSTKPIYYYQSSSIFIFSSELKVISKFLLDNYIPFEQEIDAWRCILTFGYLLEDLTPIKQVKKLRYGSYQYIELSVNSSKTHHYYNFPYQNNCNFSLGDYLESLSTTLTNAVYNEWLKDIEYNYKHFCFLSGGLDSRFNALLAHKLGFRNINSLTFSEIGTLDENIGKKISTDYGFKYNFYPLNGGKYLEHNLQNFINANDGLVILHGAAHMQSAISTINFNDFGLGHSGQIGDVIFGSYYQDGSVNDNLKKACYNPNYEIINKIHYYQNLLDNSFNGDNCELFLYKNRALNGIFNGDRVANHYFDTSSPFFDTNVIALGLKIPPKLKKNALLYRTLLSTNFPFMIRYKWQQTGTKPTLGHINEILSFLIRLKRFSQRKIGLKSDDMNPFQHWFAHNSRLSKNIISTFNNNLEYIEEESLRNDIIKTFNSKSVSNKLAAISVLLSKKLHFCK